MSDFDLEHAKHCADRTGIWRDACNEIERLRADLLASQEREAKYKVAADKWLEQLAASQLECERVREALIGYGQHDNDCEWYGDKVKDGATFCGCGLLKALSTPSPTDALAAAEKEPL